MITKLKSILELRLRVSTQLYFAIGGAVALTVSASLVGWFSFNRVGEVQSRVNEGSVPEMEAAFGIAQHSNTLVTAAPRLTSAATPQDLAQVASLIDDAHRALEGEVNSLEEKGAGDARVQRIRDHANSLVGNIEQIKTSRGELFAVAEQREFLRGELTTVNTRLDATVVPAVDDQFFYTMTGYRSLNEPPVDTSVHFSEGAVTLYRNLAEIQADVNVATQLLVSVFSLSEAPLIEPLRERFEAIAGRIQRRMTTLRDDQVRAELEPIFSWLFALGMGDGSGFDLRAQELNLLDSQQDLLANNRAIAVDLVDEVDGLVSAANANVQEATRASTQAILTGRTLLLAISAVSIGGALLISWLYIWRSLLRRLQTLSSWMRQMARGDLEAKVDIGGRDEVADMAAALEVFRRHALEVQRLNLVERLAEELQGKNEELETVLADLRRAQDQIVMREKLAALGELTAGVAHEIRNPLNFVNNFSEVSEELLAEVQEILQEAGGELNADQQGLIQDIFQDLTSNLERIRTHGKRADRIVHDMLTMGRGGGGHQPTDINNLLDEYANLAYHSARATNPDFQLALHRDFDPNVGEIEAIPHDLGRVFLNMVANACHATNDRRLAGEAPESSAEGYTPSLWLSTRRGENHVEIRLRDNGAGIPADVIDKIFNPFFTTKPTDQGTGLGLAISNDIVRQHGGAISVQSEPGQFTEMTIELPIALPETPAEDEEEDEEGSEEREDEGAAEDGQ